MAFGTTAQLGLVDWLFISSQHLELWVFPPCTHRNLLDWANFLFFIVVFLIRLYCDAMVEDRLDRIQVLSDMEDLWSDEQNHLPMYRLGA